MAVQKKVSKKTSTKSASQKPDKTYALNLGDLAPRVLRPMTSGGEFNLKSVLSGPPKVAVVLYFYPKDNTSGCTLESQDFAKLHKDFLKAGAVVLGVSRDSLRSHENFKSKFAFPFELISDEDESLCRAFDVIQTKSMYGRKYEGVERSTFVITANGRVAAVWRNVKVPGHVAEVLGAVKGLP